jgi:hypothetical protein
MGYRSEDFRSGARHGTDRCYSCQCVCMLCAQCLLSSVFCQAVRLFSLWILSLHSQHNSRAVDAYQCACMLCPRYFPLVPSAAQQYVSSASAYRRQGRWYRNDSPAQNPRSQPKARASEPLVKMWLPWRPFLECVSDGPPLRDGKDNARFTATDGILPDRMLVIRDVLAGLYSYTVLSG